ncbi:MAG: peptidyl-prolyl cis-trans isomerase [Methyloprofundus sp.]|nr:peptidyl-prolyl cis-trans isomerase [Methyloprofundus sp.]MBW6452643.1 peptidyl-prolyl cis-trans isomerase [Methyloprofundus sp.]
MTACQEQPPAPEVQKNKVAAAPSNVVVTINNHDITQEEFDFFKQESKAKNLGQDFSDKELLQQFINIELWAQEARKQLLDQKEENRLRIKLMTKQFYAEQAKKHLQITKAIDSEQIRAEYNRRYQGSKGKQIKLLIFEHTDRAQIVEVLNSIKMGAQPRKLASLSSDAQFQETDWLYISALEPALLKVVESLQLGQFTQEPVPTEKGWQLVWLEEVLEVPKPEMTKVRDIIIAALEQRQMETRNQVLLDAADIVKR